MIPTRLYPLLATTLLLWSHADADYDCMCNYKVETGVFATPDDTGSPIGYMYEFDCKPIYGPLVKGFSEIEFEHQVAYVKVDDEVQSQMCQGDIPDSDKVTTLAPTTTTPKHTTPVHTTPEPTTPKPTTTTTTPKPTTTTTTPKPTTTTTTTTPKPTTTTTTPKPTTTTTTTTPKPTTTTTTPKPTTTTTTTTPKPTTTTTTPKPTTTTTTTPKPTTTTTTTPKPTTTTIRTTPKPLSIPEGHTELCPKGIQTDIGLSHGYVGQYGNYCYEYVPTSTQWGNAERHCKIVSSGHLTSIMNDHEQAFVLKFLASHGHSDPVWIGLTDSDAEGTWEWTSGEAVTYKHFQTLYQLHTTKDHKLNDCIVLKSNGEWTDIACGVTLAIGFGLGEHHSFVCQYNLTSHPPSVFGDGILTTFVG